MGGRSALFHQGSDGRGLRRPANDRHDVGGFVDVSFRPTTLATESVGPRLWCLGQNNPRTHVRVLSSRDWTECTFTPLSTA